MNKILRYSFVCLLAMMSTAIFAKDDVVIDFNSMDVPTSNAASQDGSIEASDAGDINSDWTKTIDGVTITVSPKEEGKTNPNRIWKTGDGPQLRCYSGTITISASETMTSIKFVAPKFDLKADNGTIASKTWTGESTEVVFTVNANTQINSITVSFGGGGDTPPTPSFDGPTVSNIAAFLECTEEAKLQLSDALVTYVNDYNGLQLFVRDNTGAMVIDNKMDFTGIKTGDILTCDIIGKPGSISGFKNAFLKSDNSSIENLSTSTGEVTYKEISIDEARDFICDAIVLKNATIADKKASVDGDEIALYDRFKLGLLDELDESATYNVYGLIYDGGTQYGMEIVVVKIELADNSGVNAITANKNSNAPVYNMAGQRVSKAVKGVYIQNGKKFVVK